MNKAYKVVFNKLRGTMMVVNEVTSAIQKKGAKAVIAVAAVSMSSIAVTASANAVMTQGLTTVEWTQDLWNGESRPGSPFVGEENTIYKVIEDITITQNSTSTIIKSGAIDITEGKILTLVSTDIGGTLNGVIGFYGSTTITGAGNLIIKSSCSPNGNGVTANAGISSGSHNIEVNTISIDVEASNQSYGLYSTDKNVVETKTLTAKGADGEGNSIVITSNGGDGVYIAAGKANDVTTLTAHYGTIKVDGEVGLRALDGKIVVDAKSVFLNNKDSTSERKGAIYAQNEGKIDVRADETLTIGDGSQTTAINITGNAKVSLQAKNININGAVNSVLQDNEAVGAATLTINGNVQKIGNVSGYKGEVVLSDGALALNNTTGYFGGNVTVNGGTLTLNGVGLSNGQKLQVGSSGTLAVAGNLVNEGEIELAGTLTIQNGFIDNYGKVTFTDTSKVIPILSDADIENGKYLLVQNESGENVSLTNNNKSLVLENGLYNLEWEPGNTGYILISKKTAQEVIGNLPLTSQQSDTFEAIFPTIGANGVPPQLSQIANAISAAAQAGNGEAVAQIAEDLAPSTAPVVSSVSQGVNNAIAGVANARMAANRAAGDVFTGGSAWAQVIYNSADQDATKKTAKLESDTYGVTVGVDGKIGDNLTIGAGFGVTKTDAESGTRDIDVDSYALFGYTEYNADNGWFVNGMVNAIRGRYEENKAPAGIKLTAKYQTTVLGAGVATGYHFENGISPEVGLRYLRTHQGSYNDGAQKIHTDGTNLLTAAIGAKYEKAFEQGDWKFTPSARVAATYDVVSDDTESAIRVIGGGQYHVISAHQKRAAYEAGLGLEASNGDWDFSVAYNGEFRSHFKSHTGMIKAKYNF